MTTPTPDGLLRRLPDPSAMMNSIKPNDNAGGEWKALRFSPDGEWSILGPCYAHDPKRRMLLGIIRIDGLTNEEADANARAVTEFIVDSVNVALTAAAAEGGVGR